MKKAHVISVDIRKGGAGKTTTSVNLAAGLQLRGHKTLLIDLDDQANATMCVGINPFTLERSIADIFTDVNVQPQDVIQKTEYGLSVLPATQSLERIAAGMTATSIGELKPIIEALRYSHDYIIIDTQPGHGYLSLSALIASDYILIPLQAHYLAMEGLARIMGEIEKLKKLNPKLSLLGIVPCMIQAKTNIGEGVISQTKEDYPDKVFDVRVRLSVDFVESTLKGCPLVVLSPNHRGSQEYMKLVDAVIEKLEDKNG